MSGNSVDRMMTPEPTSSATSDVSEPLSPSPSGDSSATSRTIPAMPGSPTRPQQLQQQPQPAHSVPSSPAPPPPTPTELSPAVTPTQQQRINVFAQSSAETGVVLGLEQLERQQDAAERRRRREQQQLASRSTQRNTLPHQPQGSTQTSPVMTQRYLDDDTAPSSTLESGTTRDGGSHAGDGSLGSGDDVSSQEQQRKESTKFGRMIKNTRRRLSSNEFLRRRSSDMDDPAEEDEDEGVDALIYGHLQKLGRNGKWQTRWFESDGECLSYYKTSKRSKLLATLDLEKVGAIVVNEEDPKGCSFTIQVLGRPYYLRAESRAACKDWVITLNRVKEARLQQGNVKLIHQHKHILFRSPPDLLDQGASHLGQGVTLQEANRPRTRAVDDSTLENIEEIMLKGGAEPSEPELAGPAYYQSHADENESISQVVLARWQKRKTSMSKLASKLSRWARSLRKYQCSSEVEGDVRLDRHVHPPGHDDVANKRPVQKSQKSVEREVVPPPKDPTLSGWIGKETSRSLAVTSKATPVIDPMDVMDAMDAEEPVPEIVDLAASDPVTVSASSGSSSATPDSDEEELETRYLS